MRKLKKCKWKTLQTDDNNREKSTVDELDNAKGKILQKEKDDNCEGKLLWDVQVA